MSKDETVDIGGWARHVGEYKGWKAHGHGAFYDNDTGIVYIGHFEND